MSKKNGKARGYRTRSIGTKPITRSAIFLPETVNRDLRTIDVTWSTGARVFRAPWDEEPFYEELSTDPLHIRTERLENGAPLLDSHNDARLDDQIGSVERIWFEDGVARATVRFRSNPKSLEIFQDVADGIIRNLSIGYVVHKFIEQRSPGDQDYRTFLAVDYTVYELSFVPINADAKAQTRSSSLNEIHPTEIRSLEVTTKNKNQPPVEDDETTDDAEDIQTRSTPKESPKPKTDEPKTPDVDIDSVRKEAVEAERKRVSTIRSLVKRGGLDESIAETLIDKGTTLERAREKIFEAVLEKDSGETRSTNSRVVPGELDEIQTRRNALANAISHRHSSTVKLEEYAYQYRGISLLDVAKECLDQRGIKIPSRQKIEIVRRSLNSTSDFPAILANVSNKVLLASFERLIQRQTFTPLVRIASAPDFKQMTKVRLGEHPSFKEIPEGAEITAGTIGEGKESYRIASYGRKIGLTRQAIINDDLSAFNVLGNFGAAGARLESLLVWSIFIDNPIMGDGKSLFSAEHGNLAGDKDGQLIDVTGLSDAEYAMSVQTGIDKRDFLNIEPKYLVVPSRMKTEAIRFVSQRYLPNKQADYNPFEGGLQVISEPRLNILLSSTHKPWFLAADSSEGVEMIELSYLDGIRSPQTESQVNFDTGSFEVKAWIDMGAKAMDWRGLYKVPGKQS